jgi:hypothetical protein
VLAFLVTSFLVEDSIESSFLVKIFLCQLFAFVASDQVVEVFKQWNHAVEK